VRERALGVMLTWRGQAWAPSPTRISCRRTPGWCAPISTPTDVTRPATRAGSLLGRPSTNRWAPADQRTENTASQPPDAPSQDRSGVLHGNAAVTTGSVVARPSFAPDGAHASHSHRQYDYGGRRGAREVRERALGVMLTWRGQAWTPSPTRISCRRTPGWYAPISTPTDVTRPIAGCGPSL
jgi:hypothetical protein